MRYAPNALLKAEVRLQTPSVALNHSLTDRSKELVAIFASE